MKRILGVALSLVLAIPVSVAATDAPGVARDELALGYWIHPTGRDGIWKTSTVYLGIGWRFENNPDGRRFTVGGAGVMRCRERKTKNGTTGRCVTIAGDFRVRRFEVETAGDEAHLVATSPRTTSVVDWRAAAPMHDAGIYDSLFFCEPSDSPLGGWGQGAGFVREAVVKGSIQGQKMRRPGEGLIMWGAMAVFDDCRGLEIRAADGKLDTSRDRIVVSAKW